MNYDEAKKALHVLYADVNRKVLQMGPEMRACGLVSDESDLREALQVLRQEMFSSEPDTSARKSLAWRPWPQSLILLRPVTQWESSSSESSSGTAMGLCRILKRRPTIANETQGPPQVRREHYARWTGSLS
jgi:hypothetical protein